MINSKNREDLLPLYNEFKDFEKKSLMIIQNTLFWDTEKFFGSSSADRKSFHFLTGFLLEIGGFSVG